jgi:hypothetical protein
MKRFIPILCMLMLASLACSIPFSGGSDSSDPASTQLPENILFQDDFSDPSSGWDRINQSDGITDYADGVYRIFVNTVNTDIWSNPGLDFGDVRVEVDATKVGGNDNNDFGVICRYQDSDNYYFFIASSDGYYGIGRFVGGKQELIGVESMPPSEVIKKGDATNHLRADCIGSKLSLFVNDQFLTQVEDTAFTSGDVGLLAGSLDSPGVDIHFDNFKALKP